MGKRYKDDEKRAVLDIVDACMVFADPGGEWKEHEWIGDVLCKVSGRPLLWVSWIANVERWKKEFDPVPYSPCKHKYKRLIDASAVDGEVRARYECLDCEYEWEENL